MTNFEKRYTDWMDECRYRAAQLGMSLPGYIQALFHFSKIKAAFEWEECDEFILHYKRSNKKNEHVME